MLVTATFITFGEPDRRTMYFAAKCSEQVCTHHPLNQHATVSSANMSCNVAASADLMQTDDAQAVCVLGGGSKHVRHIGLLS